jgi:biofilm protein TabA
MDGNLDLGLNFLLSAPYIGLSDGTCAIIGDRVYAHVYSFHTRKPDEIDFECHREYADLHPLIDRKQTIYRSPIEWLGAAERHPKARDTTLLTGDPCLAIELEPGMSIEFLSQKVRKPGCVSSRS